ncbi:hypothetical protein HK100_000384 [Physocladia obscura]|uniref:Flavodoxin-like domain-containing protein n=1 Tax=Physocladia obscura TaxID=109957 RepID=A0AAD5T097_9FUNG|nr:hypothetical protein HK100_000383 [Physocladia obscura]KAJ3119287.1 hypothetical protein HK100_000384 [Physocladia obscura]
MVKPKVYVIIHSFWGHIKTLADSVVAGLEAEGAEVTLYRVPETLPKEVLDKLWAKSFDEIPVIKPEDLVNADGFLFGVGTRFGSPAAQVKAFWDATGKFGGVFTSTGSQHGGQETTIQNFISHYVHHGINFVPVGFTHPNLQDNSELIGGSPWGAATIAGGDGSRQVSEKEKEIAKHQGAQFAKLLNKVIN